MALWLLTRPEADSARTLKALAAAGHQAVVAPVIGIDTASPDPIDLVGVQAILFTSANGVRAFARLSPRRDLPVLTVGAASAAEARQAGFGAVTSADGDAVALADLAVRTCDPSNGPLFHAAGKDTAGDLSARLTAAGFGVRRRVLYRAAPVDHLPEAAVRTLDDPALAGSLFFSPRTAKTFDRLVREAGKLDRLARLAAVCLSPAVAGRLDRSAWGEVRIAERPDMDALVAQLDPPPVPSVTVDSARMASRDDKTNETKPESAPAGAPRDDDATGTPPAAPIGAPSAEPEMGAAADVPRDPAEGGDPPADAAGRVIDAFGGIRPMAAKLGAPVTTVQGWKKRGHIPPGRQDEIKAAAAEHGIDLDPDLLAAAVTESEEAERAATLAEGTATEVEAAEVTGADSVSAAEATPGAARDDSADAPRPWGATTAASDPDAVPAPEAERAEPESEPERPAAPAPMPPPAAPVKTGRGIAWLALLVAVVAGGGALWIVYSRPPAALPGPPDRLTELERQIAGLEERVPATVAPIDDGLADRVAALEDGVAATDALAQRVDALEQQVAEAPAGVTAEDLATVSDRLAAVEADVEAAGDATAAAGPDLSDLEARVAGLEQLVREGAAGDGAAAGAAAAEAVAGVRDRLDSLTETLNGRIDDVSAAVEAVRTASADGDAALEGRIEAAAGRIDAVAAQMEPLAGRLEDLAGRIEAVAETVGQVSASDSTTQALVLAVGQLRDSLRSGAFADALDRVRALVGDDTALTEALDAIAPQADTGIPTRATLTARYPRVARDIRQAAAGEREGDWVDRSLAAVQGLVTVRRDDGEVQGDDPGSITARALGRLERDDLAGAVEALAALDGAAAAAAEPWLADARDRLAAEAALDQLTLEAVDRLGGLPPGGGPAPVEAAPEGGAGTEAEAEADAGGNG